MRYQIRKMRYQIRKMRDQIKKMKDQIRRMRDLPWRIEDLGRRRHIFSGCLEICPEIRMGYLAKKMRYIYVHVQGDGGELARSIE